MVHHPSKGAQMSRIAVSSTVLVTALLIAGCNTGPQSDGVSGGSVSNERPTERPVGTEAVHGADEHLPLPDSTIQFLRTASVQEVGLSSTGHVKWFIPTVPIHTGAAGQPLHAPLQSITVDVHGGVTDYILAGDVPVQQAAIDETFEGGLILSPMAISVIRSPHVRQVSLAHPGVVAQVMLGRDPVSAPGVPPVPIGTPLEYVTFNPQGEVIDWKPAILDTDERSR
jgi:hypothetical protein